MLLDKNSYFSVVTEKETGILSAINVQERNYMQSKPSIDWLHVLEELGVINAVNVMWNKSVNSSLLKRLLSFKNINIC